MAKNADTGLKQLPDGNWTYRVTYTRDGKKGILPSVWMGTGSHLKEKLMPNGQGIRN